MIKKRLTSFLLLLAALLGLLLLLYPMVSDAWNARHASRMISTYSDTLDDIDNEDYAQYWDAAMDYNKKVKQIRGHIVPEELLEEYNAALDVAGLGIMGYLEIPRIGVSLPVYHGTSPEVLQIAVGHLEWSDLPIGGIGNHSVLSGHRGLTSAKLLSDLPMMELGDVFYVRVLNEMLTYQVDQIRTVLPEEVDTLDRDPERDYCSLVTCTPYGINSHRLIVRGHRISNTEETKSVLITSEASRVEPKIVAGILFGLAVAVLLLNVTIKTEIQRDRKKKR